MGRFRRRGKVDEGEMQNAIGVDEEEMQDRVLDKFGNADEALKAADADGDGQVSKEEMKKIDPDGDGKIDGETFKDFSKAKADDLQDRIVDKMGSADEAMKQWDKDG